MKTVNHPSAPNSTSLVHEWAKLCRLAIGATHGTHGIKSNNPVTYGRFHRDLRDCPKCKAEDALRQAVMPKLLDALISTFYAVNFEHRHRTSERRDDCDICRGILAVYEADDPALDPGALTSGVSDSGSKS